MRYAIRRTITLAAALAVVGACGDALVEPAVEPTDTIEPCELRSPDLNRGPTGPNAIVLPCDAAGID